MNALQKKLKVGLLGITHPHASGRVKALQRRADIEIVGAADHSELLPAFCSAMNLNIRTKEEILNDPEIDIVLVHSKSYEMADLTIEALRKGKAVLVEKPAGRGVEDTQRIVEAVKENNGLVQVGYCWRFAPSINAMQDCLTQEKIGKVLQVRAHAGCSHNEAETAHMRQPGDLGGAFFVIGCHLFDRVLYHFGMPKSVNARITKFNGFKGDESREDAAGAILNYDDKIVVVDFMSWDVLPWTESWDMTAYGTEGIMSSRSLPSSYKLYQTGKIDGTIQGWTEWHETSFPEIWATKKTEYSPEIAEIGNPIYFDRELDAFLDSLRNGKPSQVPAEQAHNISILLAALFKSAEINGAEIFIK